MKFLLPIILVLASFLGGSWYAVDSIKSVDKNQDFLDYNGVWRFNPTMDLSNPRQRALIAKVGLFALRESEVVYFTAETDSEGNTLSSDHTYKIEGSVPTARYWSYTLYGSDNFLIPNTEKIYGFNASSITYNPIDSLNPELENVAQSSYTMHISKDKMRQNWIPSGDNDQLVITLRLYNASPEIYNNLNSIPLPTITKLR